MSEKPIRAGAALFAGGRPRHDDVDRASIRHSPGATGRPCTRTQATTRRCADRTRVVLSTGSDVRSTTRKVANTNRGRSLFITFRTLEHCWWYWTVHVLLDTRGGRTSMRRCGSMTRVSARRVAACGSSRRDHDARVSSCSPPAAAIEPRVGCAPVVHPTKADPLETHFPGRLGGGDGAGCGRVCAR